jgi:hypothetical protein
VTQGSIFKDKKSVARALLAAFVFPWIFDVRSVLGFEWLLYIQILSLVFSTVVFALTARILKKRADLGPLAGNALSVTVCAIFVFVSMISGFVEHNDLFKVFAFSIPTVLFIFSLIMISLIAQTGLKPEDVIDVIAIAAIAAIIIRIPIVAILFGIDFDTVRYEILCGATAVGTAYILSRVPGGLRPYDILFALIHLIIILLSVTRTAILNVFSMAGVLILCMAGRIARPQTLITVGLTLPLSALAIYAVAVTLPGNPIGRWIARTASFQTGDVDLSGVERESQIVFELDKLSGAGIERLIGFGIAAPGGHSAALLALVTQHGDAGIYVPTGFADHTYVCLIFLGGVLGGGPLLLAQLLWLWNSVRAIRFVLKTYPNKLSWVTMAPLAVVGYQVSNFLAASFADRSQSIFFGLCLGVTGWLTAARRREAPIDVKADVGRGTHYFPNNARTNYFVHRQ